MIRLGNLKTLTDLSNNDEDKIKLEELENKLKDIGYSYEENCEKNTDTTKKTYHIYDIPKFINFSILDK